MRAHGGRIDRDIWFHDLLDESAETYDPIELSTIQALTGSAVQTKRKRIGAC